MRTTKQLLDLGLPKWPHMTVEGSWVTKEQAAEIILRTDSAYFSCNDREWTAMLCRAAGIEMEEPGWPDYTSVEAYRERIRALSLEYLTNAQILSAYIGGPHGWCQWDGRIRARPTTGIGKWPDMTEVMAEWEIIAAAFPYLTLTSQLWPESVDGDRVEPIAEFVVEAGKAHIREPVSLHPLWGEDMEGAVLALFTNPHRERGCTISQYEAALAATLGEKTNA